MGESMTTYYTMDIATIISEYLYGTVTPPENLEDRLRDASITTGPTLDVDVANYMASCGRFSSPFQTTVVQKFFDGTLDLSHYSPDQSGATSVSFDQLMLDGVASKPDGSVYISQYQVGTTEADWALRGFIDGSTEFLLSPQTKFVIDDTGRHLEGACMIPYNDDFDLSSSSSDAQLANDYIFRDWIDP